MEIKEVDLFCIGQALHWLDVEKTLEEIPQLMSPESYFQVLGYASPVLLNAEAFPTLLKREIGDFSVVNGSESYEFEKDNEKMTMAKESYE